MRVHYSGALVDEDRDCIDRIPVTAVPRTLLDLAASVSTRNLERALERSEEQGSFDLFGVDAAIARAAGHPGVGRLQRALAIYRPSDFVRSEFERKFLAKVRSAGLPSPSANFSVGAYTLDLYWSSERFAVELDVFETHGSRDSFESDRLRQEDLKLMGIEIVRITAPRFEREPTQVIERIGSLLAQRRRQLSSSQLPGE